MRIKKLAETLKPQESSTEGQGEKNELDFYSLCRWEDDGGAIADERLTRSEGDRPTPSSNHGLA